MQVAKKVLKLHISSVIPNLKCTSISISITEMSGHFYFDFWKYFYFDFNFNFLCISIISIFIQKTRSVDNIRRII
jgi:hypothetical protein